MPTQQMFISKSLLARHWYYLEQAEVIFMLCQKFGSFCFHFRLPACLKQDLTYQIA